MEKRSLLDRLDAAFLIVDELVDRGYVVTLLMHLLLLVGCAG